MPRTLAQNATYINETIKPAIKAAIEAQGVTVPSTDSFLDYADRISEIEGGGSGYQLKDLPTGAISTVNDAAPLPLNALKVSIEAVQSGSGTPSPSNIRPISGWDSGEITFCGNNIFNIPAEAATNNNVTFTPQADGGIKIQGKAQGNANYYITNNNALILKSGTYTWSCQGVTDRIYWIIGGANNTAGLNYYAISNLPQYGTECTQTIQGGTTGYNLIQVANGTEVDTVLYPQVELGSTATTYEPYQGNQYTQQFPTTIYGAEWDVVNGGLKQTDGYIASYNGETLPSTWISDRDEYASGTTPTIGAEVVYKLATPTIIDLSPLSIRMLEGTNNIFADCGDVIEGEYFIDEGAIDVRKVDYQIGASGSIKTTDGRVLSGFASMSGYHARPLDASGNWLDVDWSKDFEIGVAFKFTAFPTYQGITGDGNYNSWRKAPRMDYDNSEGKIDLCVSSDGSTLAIDAYLDYSLVINKWYFIKLKFVQSTMTLTVDITEDFSTFTSLYNNTMASAPYHDAASLCFGGDAQQSNMASNTFLIDTFNTYIKGDGADWGAFTGVFPS